MRAIAIHRLRGKDGNQVAPGKEFDPKHLGIDQAELETLAKRGAVRVEGDANPGVATSRGQNRKTQD
ncbi:MAG: hypothetical protein ACOCPR_05445 [Guyparkeria sp.]